MRVTAASETRELNKFVWYYSRGVHLLLLHPLVTPIEESDHWPPRECVDGRGSTARK